MAYEYQGDLHVRNHLRGRNFSLHASIITTSASPLALDSGSPSALIFEGTDPQTVMLPDATECLIVNHQISIFNDSEAKVTIRDFGNNELASLVPGASLTFHLKDNSTPVGIWLSARIQLSSILVDLGNIVGVSGYDAQSFLEDYLSQVGIPIRNEVPGGAVDCENLDFTLAFEAVSGSMQPSLDGRLLTPGLDFVESLDRMGFTILLNPADSNRLNSPPHRNEDLLVSYSRRVIF